MLVVDGNSLLHRSFHALATSELRTSAGQPVWAIKGFWAQVGAAIERVGAGSVLVGFDSKKSLRTEAFAGYKAGRSEKAPDLIAQLESGPAHFSKAGLHVVVVDGYEADDVIASAAARNTAEGVATVIATSDRDAFSLINDEGPGVRVLRIINGGPDAWPLLTSERLRILCGVDPGEYRLFAALRGDSSDNLVGVDGIGPKTAVKLIESMRTDGVEIDSVLADHDAGGSDLATRIGKSAAAKFSNAESRTNLERNLQLMSQTESLDVGPIADALLPLPSEQFAAEISALELQVRPYVFTSVGATEGDNSISIVDHQTADKVSESEPELVLF